MEEVSLHDGGVLAVLLGFHEEVMQFLQAVVGHKGKEMMRQVPVHPQRENGEADAAADQKDARVREPPLVGMTMLNDLAKNHAEGESRPKRHQPKEKVIESPQLA